MLTNTDLTISALSNAHADSVVVHEFVFAGEHPICFLAFHQIHHVLEVLLGLQFLLLALVQTLLIRRLDCIRI